MKWVALSVSLLLAGCWLRQPDRSKFFTLTPVAQDGPAGAIVPRGKLALGLGPILLPGYLTRTQLVERVGPNQVRLMEEERWAEPLGEGFRRTLQQNLVQLLGADRVVVYPWPIATRLDARIGIEVLHFEPLADRSAELAARWTISDGAGGKILVARESRVTEPSAGDDTAAAVAAMSRALAKLSEEIARALPPASALAPRR